MHDFTCFFNGFPEGRRGPPGGAGPRSGAGQGALAAEKGRLQDQPVDPAVAFFQRPGLPPTVAENHNFSNVLQGFWRDVPDMHAHNAQTRYNINKHVSCPVSFDALDMHSTKYRQIPK